MDPSIVWLSVGAALQGQAWVDESFQRGEVEHRYYTSVVRLADQDSRALHALIGLIHAFIDEPDRKVSSTDQIRRMKKVWLPILRDLGFDI
jgi:hypothetical protein